MTLPERARTALWRVPVGLQLSALYTLLLVAILALLGWALYSQLDQFLVQNTADRLERTATSLLAAGAEGPRGGRGQGGPPGGNPLQGHPFSPDPTSSFVVRQLSAPDVTVAVLDVQGKVITSTESLGGTPRDLPALPSGWLASVSYAASGGSPTAPMAEWVLPAAGGGRQLVVVQQFDASPQTGDPQDRLLVLQATSLDAADAILNQLRLYLVLGVLAGTVIGVLAGLALTRAVLRPLDRMARTAEAISGGDLTRRLRLPAGRNEVARLGGAFDHMVDRLANTLHAQQRFIADASHELRTPLTSLEGLSELLLLGADRGDSQAVQRIARSIYGELGRMGRLVADLLTLSRLDSDAPTSLVPVDAGKLLDEVAEQVAPLAEARQIRLTAHHEGALLVRAEPDRLKQVVLNLVDNALRYTPAEGEITLTATPGTGQVRLTVQDSGPGIAPEHLAHIFDRFYRADASRARTSGNSGLGLAIVHGIIESYGGTIAVQSTLGAGTCFTITLPTDRAGTATAAQNAGTGSRVKG